MTIRKLTAAAALALTAAVALTACSSKVGAAAYVGSTKISEKSVDDLLTKAGPDAANVTPGAASPRVSALSELLQVQVFERALAADGGVPTDAQLDAVHDDAIQLLAQADQTGSQYDTALVTAAKSYGLSSKFASLAVRSMELEYTYIERSKVTTPTELADNIAKLKIPVTVSGRYGAWDPSTLQVSAGQSDGTPSFVSFPAADAAASASAAANSSGTSG